MATWHEPAMAMQMIRDQAFTRLVAFDINGTEPIFRCEDREPEDVCSELQRLLDYSMDAVRVECGKRGDYTDKGGKPGVGSIRKPMVWRFRPSGATKADPDPVRPVVVNGAPPEGWMSAEAHKMAIEVERLRFELSSLKGRQDDQDDQDDQDQVGKLVDLIKAVKEAVPELFGPKLSTGVAINGTAPASVLDDTELLDAIAKLKTTSPAEFEQYRGIILQQYGRKA